MPQDPKSNVTYPFRLLQRPAPVDRCYPRDISTFFSDPRTHRSTKSYSGRFECKLVAYTPLEINAQAQSKPFHEAQQIPGASIKGVVRSVAEFAGRGCVSIVSGGSNEAEFLCDGDYICPTCALFGNMTHGPNAKLLRGRVQISDAKPYQKDNQVFVARGETLYLYQSSPRAHHTAFYGPQQGISRQKFYHHQKSAQTKISKSDPNKSGQTGYSTLHPVKAGSMFVFQVNFAGLDARLVALLHYALALESGLLHKMGRGKSFGLGSVKIEIERMVIEDARARYLGEEMGDNTETIYLQQLPRDIQEKRKQLFEDNQALDDLRKMLCFEATERLPRSFGFPGHAWFKDHSQVPLRPVDEALGWAEKQSCKPLSAPPEITPQSAPQEVDTTPSWVKTNNLGQIWDSFSTLHPLCRKLAAQRYAPNLLSGLKSDIETFRSLPEGSDEAVLVEWAFRQMFGADEKGWLEFHREHLLGRPPEVKQTAQFSIEDSVAEIFAEFAARPDKFFLYLKNQRIDQNAPPKEHRAAWAKAIIDGLQKAGSWEKNPKGVQKQAQEKLREWAKG